MFFFGTGWASPSLCPGSAVGPLPEPQTAFQAMSLLWALQEMAPATEVLYSYMAGLVSDPAVRDTPGLFAVRETIRHLAGGGLAAAGAARRILCGDRTALSPLALAGHLIIQAQHLIRPQLERLIMEIEPARRAEVEHLRNLLLAVRTPLARLTQAIETAVGPELWGAAKAQAGVITGYGGHD
jgi:hypothetical protein